MSEEMIYETKYFKIAKAADVPDGERLFFELEGKPIVLFALKGEYLAIADVCSHDEGPVGEGELDGEEIVCPRHGARFSIRNGKVLSFPAVKDIPVYPVRVKDEYLEVGIQK
jgi:3-phenylpropionate/trans-cinnamate dioxygenase ferredoxin component